MNEKITILIKNSEYDKAYAAAIDMYKGEYDALYEVYDEIYEAVSAEFGRSSLQAFRALRELGTLNYNFAYYDEALKLYDMYLEYIGENYEKAAADYYDIYAKTAWVLEYYGELDKAYKMRHEILTFCLDNYGDKSVKTIRSFGELAGNVYMSGKKSEALDMFLQQYDMAAGSEECNESISFSILQNIGRCYDDLRDHEKALGYFEKAYSSAVKVYGENSFDALSVLNDISAVYSKTGRKAEAIESKEKIYLMAKDLLGEDDQNTNMAKLNLAGEYGEAGFFEKSIMLTRQAYEWFADRLGNTHSSTMLAMNNLANAYSRMGDKEKALDMREKLYTSSTQAFGEDHPNTVRYLLALGQSYEETGQIGAALDIADTACDKLRKKADEDHEFLQEGLGKAAVLNMQAERYDKALMLCDEFFDISDSSRKEGLYDLEAIYYAKSCSLSYLQRHGEALQAADKYLDVAAKIYGDDGTDVFYLDALCDYAVILMNAGQYDKALEKVSYAIEKHLRLC